MKDKLSPAVCAITLLFVIYITMWCLCSSLDREHCVAHGLQYEKTSINLYGYCRIPGGARIPAEDVGR